MAAYEYRALNQKGQQKKGILEGETQLQVRQKLREQGLIPLEVSKLFQKNKQKQKNRWWNQLLAIKVEELSLFTRQLAILVSASISIEEALNAVAAQTEKARIKKIVMALRAKILEGYSLAVAMNDFPAVFSDLYRSSVAAGEQSGRLADVLERLADYIEQQDINRKKIKHALIYPVAMLIISVVIISFLLTYIVPNIVSVFNDGEQSLPAMTIALLTISDLISNYGLYLLLGLIALIIAWVRLMTYPSFALYIHQYTLRLPLFGRVSRLTNCARFFYTLAMLRSSGVSILEAMQVATMLVTNSHLRQAVNVASYQVREGISISKALTEAKIFPVLSVHLIASGEKSGHLDEMLRRAAEYQEREVSNLVETTIALFEPMMIIVMGGIVLFIVLAILLPIFSLDQLSVF